MRVWDFPSRKVVTKWDLATHPALKRSELPQGLMSVRWTGKDNLFWFSGGTGLLFLVRAGRPGAGLMGRPGTCLAHGGAAVAAGCPRRLPLAAACPASPCARGNLSRLTTPPSLSIRACRPQLNASVPQDAGIDVAIKVSYRLREDEPVYGSCVMSGRLKNNTRCAAGQRGAHGCARVFLAVRSRESEFERAHAAASCMLRPPNAARPKSTQTAGDEPGAQRAAPG